MLFFIIVQRTMYQRVLESGTFRLIDRHHTKWSIAQRFPLVLSLSAMITDTWVRYCDYRNCDRHRSKPLSVSK